MHRKVAAALVAALALVLASCGGSETETVSRAQAISRLEAACAAGHREARRDLGSKTGQVAFVNALIANMTAVSDKVENLETTGSAKAPFDEYKATLDTRIEELEKVASADSADVQKTIREVQGAVTEANRRAHEAIVRLGAAHDCV